MFEKGPVTGAEIQPLFKFLTKDANPASQSDISWNFEKFLLDKQGRLRGRYGSFTAPDSSRLLTDIEKLLAEK